MPSRAFTLLGCRGSSASRQLDQAVDLQASRAKVGRPQQASFSQFGGRAARLSTLLRFQQSNNTLSNRIEGKGIATCHFQSSVTMQHAHDTHWSGWAPGAHHQDLAYDVPFYCFLKLTSANPSVTARSQLTFVANPPFFKPM